MLPDRVPTGIVCRHVASDTVFTRTDTASFGTASTSIGTASDSIAATLLDSLGLNFDDDFRNQRVGSCHLSTAVVSDLTPPEPLTTVSKNDQLVSKYDAVLFDSDGVLVQPPAHETKVGAARKAFEEVGVPNVDPQHVADVVSGPSVERLQEICSAYELDVDEFWAVREHRDERSQFEQFEAGARGRYDDVTAIEDLSHPSGVVSNNHHSTIAFVLDRFDLHTTFETYYGREKTVESLDLKKPNTHYLDRALADLDAESALYVGDSDSDVIAAHRAGLDSVFLRRPHSADATLSRPPTYEVDSLHEVAALLTD